MADLKLKGKLEFTSLLNPVNLIINRELNFENETIDVRECFFNFFESMNGKKASIDCKSSYINIKSDEKSDYYIEYENKKDYFHILLNKVEGFGFSNIIAYLGMLLESINGRTIIITISDDEMNITADPEEKVFGLYYTDGNCCKIPEDKVKEICKPGTSDCCIFLTAGSNGFECVKFSSLASTVLNRYHNKTMRANRIGNCAILGRKEE